MERRRDTSLMVEAATLYWEQDATQAQIAEALGVSRPTVSRLLSEARAAGIVQISIVPPGTDSLASLERELAALLGIERVFLGAGPQADRRGLGIAEPARRAISDMHLRDGDTLVVSSGQTTWDLANHAMPPLPGVVVTPAVGGQNEPEVWHQTNEIVRTMSRRSGASPEFLWSEALPSAQLHAAFTADASFQRISQRWATARAALVGIGPATFARQSISRSVPVSDPHLQSAVGDICLHFYDLAGVELPFEGSERTIRIPVSDLRRIPLSTAAAVGPHKALSILAGSRLGVFKRLITDAPTAHAVLAAAGQRETVGPSGARAGH